MKKLLAVLLAALLLPASVLAQETITANAVAQSRSVHQITAPYSGVVKPFDWETGDLLRKEDALFEMDTIKVYAPVDGTVRAMFAQPGDLAENVMSRYGMIAAVEKDDPMVVNATSSGAYNKDENRIVHVGETVYLEEINDRDNEGTGRVIAVDAKGYVVEVTSGLFDDNVSVEVYRDPSCGTKSCIGSGRTDVTVEMPVSASGYVITAAAKEGQHVSKGDLLYELAAPDAENTLVSPVITAPAEGAVELAVTSGMQVYKGQLLARIHDLSEIDVVASVDEMDLDRAAVGESVTIVFDRYPETEISGTVTAISRIGVPRQNAAYYDVTIAVTTNLELLPGMNAVVYLK